MEHLREIRYVSWINEDYYCSNNNINNKYEYWCMQSINDEHRWQQFMQTNMSWCDRLLIFMCLHLHPSIFRSDHFIYYIFHRSHRNDEHMIEYLYYYYDRLYRQNNNYYYNWLLLLLIISNRITVDIWNSLERIHWKRNKKFLNNIYINRNIDE